MSLKDQLIKHGYITEEEIAKREAAEKQEIEKLESAEKERQKRENNLFFFYRRKEKDKICSICNSPIDNETIPDDILKVNSFSELNNIVKNRKQSYTIANTIVKKHFDKIISFTYKFNNGNVKISICAECISSNLMNTKYFVDPYRNDKSK
jgi:hypothetical protein